MAQTQTYAVIGDAGLWNRDSQRTRDSILSSKIRDLILPGDNLYDVRQTYEQVWSPWSSAGLRFAIPAIGNHTRGYGEEIAFFRMPAEFYTRAENDVRWIVLNSDDEATASQQENWFRSVLSSAREKTIFVVLHHPPYTLTPHHPWTERRIFQEGFRRVLWAFRDRVSAVIAGHDHIASLVALNEIPLIISGATHEQLGAQPVNMLDGNVRVQTQWMYPGGAHWVRLDIDPATDEIWVNFVESDRNFVDCSVRIQPRPFLFRPNCSQTTRRR